MCTITNESLIFYSLSCRPHSSVELEVMFHPDSKIKYEETIAIKVNGGPDRLLRCKASIGKANCALSHKMVDYGVVTVGMPKHQNITLANAGQTDAFFHCEVPSGYLTYFFCRSQDHWSIYFFLNYFLRSSHSSELVISPNQGCVRAGSTQELEVTLTPLKKTIYDMEVEISIPGGKPLKFNVRARADIPTVALKEDEFDFGTVYVGATARLPITLSNTSMIPALVIVDLVQHPEFFLAATDSR